MKSIYTFFIIAFLSVNIISISAKTDIEIQSNIKGTSNNISGGTEFFIAFPLNERVDFPAGNLAIYVTSEVETEATLSNESTGLKVTKLIKPGKTTEFSTINGDFDDKFEIVEFEKKLKNGLKLTSLEPVSVYVMSAKVTSSEGYRAIPTDNWGTKYIHNSFYDFNEAFPWGGGFVIMASEDNTNITVVIKDGANNAKGFGETYRGKEHNDQIQVNLNAGEVYALQGNGETRGVFDLSGTTIFSDKPIGIVSYHNRCLIPSIEVSNGRDCLMEMMPPLASWGKQYASIELDRKSDKGDMFRVIAGEDNVNFTIKWYDKSTNELIGEIGPKRLSNKGDWFEYNNTGSFNQESIRGVSVFEADKPILVAQYAFSTDYDNSIDYDPFMVFLSPREQFVNSTTTTRLLDFSNSQFDYNYINLIAIGNPNDQAKNLKLLSSITINGVPTTDLNPDFPKQRIPNTDLYWLSYKNTESEAFLIEGDTPFTAFLHGLSKATTYCWPATSASKNLKSTDTLSPNVVFNKSSCEINFTVRDNPEDPRNGKINDTPRQVDVGINSIPLLKSSSFNFNEPQYVASNGEIKKWPTDFDVTDFEFTISPIDLTKNAMGVIEIKDKDGNISEVSLFYQPDSLEISIVDEGEVVIERVMLEKELQLSVKNISTIPISLNQISLSKNSNFTIADVPTPLVLEANTSTLLSLYYTPTVESGTNNFDNDIINISSECIDWETEITGKGIVPRIDISNMKFDDAKLNEGTSTQKGRMVIKNISEKFANDKPPIFINSIELDANSPDSDLFTNFVIEGSNEPISEVSNLRINPQDSAVVIFELNTNAETEGNKFARLVVLNDCGPATPDGVLPITENNLDATFDGEFSLDNTSAVSDGGYIQANLFKGVKNSVEDIILDFSCNIISTNPLRGETLRIEISNPNNKAISISLADINGKEIAKLITEKRINSGRIIEFDVTNLSVGTYFINISDGKERDSQKFIIGR